MNQVVQQYERALREKARQEELRQIEIETALRLRIKDELRQAYQEELERQKQEEAERQAALERVASMTYGGSAGDYQMYAYSFFSSYGWSEYDFQCLIWLWQRESNWNPYAHNPYSGAHGIPQSLPASKMASHGSDYWDNGYTQIRWGLDYIAGRYGSPSNAWAHSENNGWY